MLGWFKKLQEFHIQHHCGDTDNCFGVTVTWWDKIFNTGPAADKIASKNKTAFYFGKNKTTITTIQPLNS
jgi:sterol desaturase/sphingolipid hydroxylase (fatty acid hydroxylase superfamily)